MATPVSDTLPPTPVLEVVMLSDAALVPAGEAGVNVTDTDVAAPGSSVVSAGTVTLYCAAPEPAMENGGVRVIVERLLLVMVTDRTADAPIATLPKSSDAGEMVSGGVNVPVMMMSARDLGRI